MSILESVISKLFPKYQDIKDLMVEQSFNHKKAANIAQKSVKDYQAEYEIDSFYIPSIIENEKSNKQELHLSEVSSFDEEIQIRKAYLNGQGSILLVDEEEKKNMLTNAFFRTKMGHDDLSYPLKATKLNMTIPDFLYLINDQEYLILLKPRFKIENESKRKSELKRLYKYLFANIGKQIDIDPDFETSGCDELSCRLIYFRLNTDSLFIVFDYDDKRISHTFKNINNIAAGSTYGGEALKFWLYMAERTYRFYLYHPDDVEIPIDPSIYNFTKPVLLPER